MKADAPKVCKKCGGELVQILSANYYAVPDIKPYQSIITKEWITSRSHHRAHLKKHNCIEVGNEKKYFGLKDPEE